jgi:ATP-binding cassette subfamily C protein CydC
MTASAAMREQRGPAEEAPRAPRRLGAFTGLSALGLVLAALGEASALGLLALSGWFIASCAVAGVVVGSTFSYLAPSGGVRAFALGRVGASYAQRLVQHRDALARLTSIRLALFVATAGAPPSMLHRFRAGELLERAVADAETESERSIRVTSPIVAFAFLGACSAVAAGAVDVPSGLALGAGCIACVLVAAGLRSLSPDDAEGTRARARGELSGAIEAWAEMAALGAVGQVRRRAARIIDANSDDDDRVLRAGARTDLLLAAITALTLALVVATAATARHSVSSIVFVALLSVGVLEMAGGAGVVLIAARSSRAATLRLRNVREAGDGRGRWEPGLDVRASEDPSAGEEVRVRGYHIPATVFAAESVVDLRVPAGGVCLVCGRSGVGKTTLLRAIAGEWDAPDPSVSVRRDARVVTVAVDDIVFTGTVASNFRLADPAVTDDEIEALLAEFALDRGLIQSSTRTGVGGRLLSGGEARRLELARAVLAKPDILIVDEPTTAMDEGTAAVALAAVRRRLPHATLIFAMHEPAAMPGDAVPPLVVRLGEPNQKQGPNGS